MQYVMTSDWSDLMLSEKAARVVLAGEHPELLPKGETYHDTAHRWVTDWIEAGAGRGATDSLGLRHVISPLSEGADLAQAFCGTWPSHDDDPQTKAVCPKCAKVTATASLVREVSFYLEAVAPRVFAIEGVGGWVVEPPNRQPTHRGQYELQNPMLAKRCLARIVEDGAWQTWTIRDVYRPRDTVVLTFVGRDVTPYSISYQK